MNPSDKAGHFYDRLLFVFRNAAAFIPIIMLPLGFLAREDLADGRFYAGDEVFALLTALYIATSVLYLLYKKRREEPLTIIDITFLVIFHLLTLLFVLFVTGFLSAFLAVWIVLMINTDIRFGFKGFMGSFAMLAITGWLSIVIHPQLSGGEQAEVLQGAIVVGAISLIIARIRALTDRERSALAKTKEGEEYQHERLLALVNSMGDAVVATDDKGMVKVYNSTLLSLLDTNLDLADKSIDEILQLFDKDNKPVSIVQDARVRRAVYSRTDLSHKFPDGETIKLYINVAPIQPSYQSKAEHGYIFILRNITKEKTLEEEKDEFVSVVSHELRTPVTIAEGNLSNIKLLFEKGADKQILTKAVDDAHEQIIYLAKLVNDLSTLARAERGTGGSAEAIDAIALLHEIFTSYSPQAEAKKLHLNLDIPPSLPKVNANPLYLQEIMQNLVINSIKYTQTGSVTLKGSFKDGAIALEVSDTGIGISKSDQQHVFEKFYRSEDYRTRESSGTGLGLYVCKKLAEKMGLRLSFTSRLNHGSTFTLLIPSNHLVVEEAAPAASAAASPPNNGAQPVDETS